MRRNPSESDPGQDGISKAAMERAEAAAEGPQSDSEVLRALAAAVDRNERAQERFRNAVVRRLARLEARARLLQMSKIIDWVPGSVSTAVEREAGIEAMVAEVSEEIERKMLNEISGERSPASARRGRPRKWADWAI